MGNIHILQVLSWVHEGKTSATYNVRPAALYGAGGTDTFLFGEMAENFTMPSPKPVVNEISTYAKWDVSSLEQDKIVIEGQIPFTVKNGVELYYAFGDCTTTTSGTPWTHAITGLDSGDLPSRSWHGKTAGGTTDLDFDVSGVKTAALTLTCGTGSNASNLMAQLSYIGSTYIDSATADTNPAVAQTTAPVLPPVLNNTPFRMGPSAANITWDSVNFTELLHVSYTMTNLIHPVHTNQDGLDQYGKPKKRWAEFVHELGVRRHRFLFTVYQKNQAILNDLLDQLNAPFIIKWERDTNDYIQLTATNTEPLGHEMMYAVPGTKALYVIPVQPESVAVEVVDTLDIDYYEVS